jgi:ActD protein
MKLKPIYGLLAEFETPQQLLEAAQRTYDAGFRKIDAYSPLPIHGLDEAVGFHGTILPAIVFTGGLLGGLTGFGMQWYANVISYPLNVGGKPYNSWPHFIPITFELTVLGAALCAVFGMFALNGLPRPYHPVFNVPRFALASDDRFFLVVKAKDKNFDLDKTKTFLDTLRPFGVYEVEE